MKKYSKAYINKIVKACSRGNQRAWEEFLRIFSQKIYNFPCYVTPQTDMDFQSEFYIYVVERLKNGKRFKSFNPKIASFDTWFDTVLLNFYKEFKRHIALKEKIITSSLDQALEYDKSIISFTDENIPGEEKAIISEIREKIKNLSPEKKVFLKLYLLYYYYPVEFSEKEIKFMLKVSGSNLNEIIKRIEETIEDLREKSRKYTKEISKLDGLFNKNQMILHELKQIEVKLGYFEEMDKLYPGDLIVIEKLLNKKDKLLRTFEKNQKRIDTILKKLKYGKFIIVCGKRKIAYILNMNEDTVGTKIHRILKELKDIIKPILEEYE